MLFDVEGLGRELGIRGFGGDEFGLAGPCARAEIDDGLGCDGNHFGGVFYVTAAAFDDDFAAEGGGGWSKGYGRGCEDNDCADLADKSCFHIGLTFWN